MLYCARSGLMSFVRSKLTPTINGHFCLTSTRAASSSPTNTPLISILHFNDVYHLTSRKVEPVGGAARFQTRLKELEKEHSAMVTFGGDAFSPCLLATVMRGDHMLPILNKFGIVASVVGNHDFDHGVDRLDELVKKSNFDWLLSNALTPTGKPIAHSKQTKLVDWHGIKVGFMGLIEKEWIETLAAERDLIVYTSFIDTARKLSQQLRDQGPTLTFSTGAQIVVALTHMRLHNDEKLAAASTGVDLILGGHDHNYELKTVAGQLIVKGGTDFRDLTLIKVFQETGASHSSTTTPSSTLRLRFEAEHIEIKSNILEDPEVAQIVEETEKKCATEVGRFVGFSTTALDVTAHGTRRQESNLGNLVCDLFRNYYRADCAIVNGGSFRSDAMVGPGPISLSVLTEMFPFENDVLIPMKIRGDELIQVLEHGYAAYPAYEGRFPQVSGLRITVDMSRPAYDRIVSLTLNGESIDPTKTYTVVVSSYMLGGGDGFTMLKGKPTILKVDEGKAIIVVLRNELEKLRNVSIFNGAPYDKFLPISPLVDGRIQIMNGVARPPDVVQDTSMDRN